MKFRGAALLGAACPWRQTFVYDAWPVVSCDTRVGGWIKRWVHWSLVAQFRDRKTLRGLTCRSCDVQKSGATFFALPKSWPDMCMCPQVAFLRQARILWRSIDLSIYFMCRFTFITRWRRLSSHAGQERVEIVAAPLIGICWCLRRSFSDRFRVVPSRPGLVAFQRVFTIFVRVIAFHLFVLLKFGNKSLGSWVNFSYCSFQVLCSCCSFFSSFSTFWRLCWLQWRLYRC